MSDVSDDLDWLEKERDETRKYRKHVGRETQREKQEREKERNILSKRCVTHQFDMLHCACASVRHR